ncbi:hypothetical protein BaRGS_00021972 [Batillaria attramentaria]|uniref:Uncharacterized protein n=1 Tax=Batillaria attramentaria TaxID=370345 RepID=A0ABD0KHY5_9CAEN
MPAPGWLGWLASSSVIHNNHHCMELGAGELPRLHHARLTRWPPHQSEGHAGINLMLALHVRFVRRWQAKNGTGAIDR